MYTVCAIVRNTSCAPDLVCVLQSQTDILLHAGIIFVKRDLTLYDQYKRNTGVEMCG